MIQKVIISFRCTCTRRRKSINSGEMWRVRSATIFASLLPVALHVRACAVAFPNPVCLDRGCYVTLTIHLQHYGRPISPFITRGEKRTQAQQSCPSWDKFDDDGVIAAGECYNDMPLVQIGNTRNWSPNVGMPIMTNVSVGVLATTLAHLMSILTRPP